MSKSLPARPSLEQFKKLAKELVKGHRARDAAAFASIRECLPSLASKTDEEIVLYPFALHDAQSVIAWEYGFRSWGHLRDQLELIETGAARHAAPESSVQVKFEAICAAYRRRDFALYSSVMNEAMLGAVSKERFEEIADGKSKVYFEPSAASTYMGEMIQGEHMIYFWRFSSPDTASDLLVRLGVKDDLVSGLLFTSAFGGSGK